MAVYLWHAEPGLQRQMLHAHLHAHPLDITAASSNLDFGQTSNLKTTIKRMPCPYEAAGICSCVMSGVRIMMQINFASRHQATVITPAVTSPP
jgi:hypothetical protein